MGEDMDVVTEEGKDMREDKDVWDKTRRSWEIIGPVLKGSILENPPTIEVQVVVDTVDSNLSKSVLTESEVADALWLISTIIPHGQESSRSIKVMRTILEELTTRKLVDPWLLRSRLDSEVLERCGLVKSSKAWSKKRVQRSTRIFYTQEKYNLLREESEGYSKLIAELIESSLLEKESVDDEYCARAISNIQSLIGFFVLDPNRVVDLTLTAFEIRIDFLQAKNSASVQKMPPVFDKLLRLFKVQYVAQLVGYKFQRFHEADSTRSDPETSTENEKPKVEEKTHKSLLQMAAILIREKVVSLDSLWPHLGPKEVASNGESMLCAKEKAYRAKCRMLARKLGVVSLTKDDGDSAAKEENVLDTVKGGPLEGQDDQKVGLLAALLNLGQWDTAQELMLRLGSEKESVDIALIPEIRDALLSFADAIIAPLSNRNAKSEDESDTANKKLRTSDKRPIVPLGRREDGMVPPLTNVQQWLSAPKEHPLYSMLMHLGSQAHHDTRFLFRLTRLYRSIENREAINPEVVEIILLHVLLPSLSLTRCNAALANELWDAMRPISFVTRFRFYDNYNKEKKDQNPVLHIHDVLTRKEARRVLRRLTKENEKLAGKGIAKATHGNCTAVFDVMLEQVKGYENIIPPLVESLKYISSLSFDILVFSCIDQLSNPDRDRVKSDGTNIAQWYANLCTFTGMVLKKYSSSIDLQGVLSFVYKQLRDGDALVIFLLQEAMSRMAGISVIEDLSISQVEALYGGGPVLRDLTQTSLQAAGTQAVNIKKSANKLRDELYSSGLCSHLAIAVAQQRQSVLFGSDFRDKPLKIIGKVYDRCQDTEKKLVMMNAGDLVQFGVEPDVAFLLNRYQIDYLSLEVEDPPATDQGKEEQTDMEVDGETKAATTEAGSNGADQQPKKLGDKSIIKAVSAMLPETVFEMFSPELYATFWSLKLYDIFVPRPNYKQEINRLRNRKPESFRMDSRQEEVANAERKKAGETLDSLEKELKEHESRQKVVVSRIRERAEKFFPQHTNKMDRVLAFLERCVIPRCLMSHEDALFAAKFPFLLQEIDIEEFKTLAYLAALCRSVGQLVFSCTEAEAGRFGSFLRETLFVMERWRSDRKHFDRECSVKLSIAIEKNKSNLSHYNYCQFVNRMHCFMAKAFCWALSSEEYMEVRNALVVLNSVSDVFPKWNGHRSELLDKVTAIQSGDREDLKLMSTSYHAVLDSLKDSLLADPEPEKAAKADQEMDTKGDDKGEEKGRKGQNKEKKVDAPSLKSENKPDLQAQAKTEISSKPVSKPASIPAAKPEIKLEVKPEPVLEGEVKSTADSTYEPQTDQNSTGEPKDNNRPDPKHEPGAERRNDNRMERHGSTRRAEQKVQASPESDRRASPRSDFKHEPASGPYNRRQEYKDERYPYKDEQADPPPRHRHTQADLAEENIRQGRADDYGPPQDQKSVDRKPGMRFKPSGRPHNNDEPYSYDLKIRSPVDDSRGSGDKGYNNTAGDGYDRKPKRRYQDFGDRGGSDVDRGKRYHRGNMEEGNPDDKGRRNGSISPRHETKRPRVLPRDEYKSRMDYGQRPSPPRSGQFREDGGGQGYVDNRDRSRDRMNYSGMPMGGGPGPGRNMNHRGRRANNRDDNRGPRR